MNNNGIAFKNILEHMGLGYPLGIHPIGGSYLECSGREFSRGFNRICLYEYEKERPNTFSIAIFAGDTCAQAKDLYQHFSYQKVRELENEG